MPGSIMDLWQKADFEKKTVIFIEKLRSHSRLKKYVFDRNESAETCSKQLHLARVLTFLMNL